MLFLVCVFIFICESSHQNRALVGWMHFKILVQLCGEKNKDNKKKLRSIFDHKIVMLHPIYTWKVSSLSWQNALSDKRNITIFFRRRQVPCFGVTGHILFNVFNCNMSCNSAILAASWYFNKSWILSYYAIFSFMHQQSQVQLFGSPVFVFK